MSEEAGKDSFDRVLFLPAGENWELIAFDFSSLGDTVDIDLVREPDAWGLLRVIHPTVYDHGVCSSFEARL